MSKTNKLRLAIAAATFAVLVPGAAFAAHVSHCCGNIWCCLRHLGCC